MVFFPPRENFCEKQKGKTKYDTTFIQTIKKIESRMWCL